MHDDRLFLNLASALLSGKWLGPYNNLTLAKGPFYPIFIAVAFILGIPLLLAQHLLYITACIIFVAALRPLLRPVSLPPVYAILVFNPMSYTDGVMSRVLREGIYPALALLVVACAVGLLARFNRPRKQLLAWSIGFGFALSAFWLTREEGTWIAPSILIIIGLATVRAWQTRHIDLRQLTLLCILPFSIWIVALGVVAGINKARYGVFATVEFKSADFLAAYGALSRVKHGHFRQYVPVPKETRERIYAVSPAFAELRQFLDGDGGKGWSTHGCQALSVCDDIAGGWFMWTLRDAVAAAGHYTSGASAANYYRRLAEEVNTACAERRLDCIGKRASMMPPWNDAYVGPFFQTLARAAIYLAKYKDFYARSSPSIGTEDSLKLFRDVAGGRLSPSSQHRLHFGGWAFSPTAAVNLSVHAANGALEDTTVKLSSSQDVYQYVLSIGKDIPHAGESRFEITTSCIEGCSLYIRAGNRLIKQLPLDGSVRSLQTPELYLHLDFFDVGESEPSSHRTNMDNVRRSILAHIGRAYQAVMPILIGLAFTAYIINTLVIFRNRNTTTLWIINTAVFVAVAARMVIVSMIHVTSFPGINTLYLAPAYPLVLIFTALALADSGIGNFISSVLRGRSKGNI